MARPSNLTNNSPFERYTIDTGTPLETWRKGVVYDDDSNTVLIVDERLATRRPDNPHVIEARTIEFSFEEAKWLRKQLNDLIYELDEKFDS